MKKQSCIRIYVLLLVLLAGLCLCAAASAETHSGSCGPNTAWTLDDAGKLTISGAGKTTSNSWISYKDEIKTVVIENGITDIADQSFKECTSLTTVSLPGSLTRIGISAFYGCTSLSGVTIPNSVTTIGPQAFFMCRSLTAVTIPEKVTSLESSVFAYCSGLKTVTIKSKNCGILFYTTFMSCKNLASISIPSDHTMYVSNNGVFLTKAMDTLLFCPPAKTGTYTIPSGVKTINQYAFASCASLTEITIPKGVKEIQDYAFYGCEGLKKLSIPEGVQSIGRYSFFLCKGLKNTSLTLPHSLESIGDCAFCRCDLKQVTLFAKIRSMGDDDIFDPPVVLYAPEGSYAAKWTQDHYYTLVLTDPEYTVSVNCTEKEGTASATPAYGTKGTKVTLKASPKKGYLFNGWTVVSGEVKIENNQFQIGDKDVVIMAKFKKDPSYALVKGAEYKLNLKKKTAVYLNPTNKTKNSITIPATIKVDGVKYQVTEIAANAFKGCAKLKKVTIGKNIVKIGKNAFKGCKKLTTVTIKTTKLTKKGIGSNSFKGIASKPTFKCPKKQKDDYKTWIVKTGKAPKKSKFK